LTKLGIPLSSYSIREEKTRRKGIGATKFSVHVEEHQPHRHYPDIAAIIEASRLSEGAKERAQRVFFRLAEAEAKVHGVEIGHVHFHEVGAIDSIVDIVGTAICVDYLDVAEIHVSPLPLGGGYVETAHGKLPVPAPATAELLRGIPVHGRLGEGERVTPTGAAIVAALGSSFGDPPEMTVGNVGSGAGDRDFPDVPNILRIFSGIKAPAPLLRDQLYVVEANIDDMNPEILGFLMERLFSLGAADAAFSPLQMKKNRPGVKLTVLTPPDLLDTITRTVLMESTAIGIRYHPVARMKMERVVEERSTSLGLVKVKVIREAGAVLRVVPEYEECRRIAVEKGMPLLEVYKIIERETFCQ
jgi:uncharacterized protein (TIGR00299 family) protein